MIQFPSRLHTLADKVNQAQRALDGLIRKGVTSGPAFEGARAGLAKLLAGFDDSIARSGRRVDDATRSRIRKEAAEVVAKALEQRRG